MCVCESVEEEGGRGWMGLVGHLAETETNIKVNRRLPNSKLC